MVDYSKWNNIEVSDDEDDTHPNVDTASLFRWRHQARLERMEKAEEEKKEFAKKSMEHKKKMAVVQDKLKKVEVTKKDASESQQLQAEMEELRRQEDEFRKKEEELAKKERLTPWNVDTLSKPGFEKTVINKADSSHKKLSEEEKHQRMVGFIESNENAIKKFGMLRDYNASRDFLRDNPQLVCTDTASYLTMWCVNLEVQEKHALMERVAHQTIVMQYILELAGQLHRDPRSCVPGFFERLKTAERQYMDAFEDELSAFIERVKSRAQVRIEEATQKIEEEEREKRLGPGGLDPVEVMETLPEELKECFASRSIPRLQEVLAKMPKEESAYHMKRCIDSGLWVPDAKAAGLVPASEELRKLQEEGNLDDDGDEEDEPSDDEHYESVDGENGVNEVD